MVTPVHKNTVKAQLRHTGRWEGYVAQSNVNSLHIKNGWTLGYPVNVSSIEELEELIARFQYANSDPELGRRVRFWEES